MTGRETWAPNQVTVRGNAREVIFHSEQAAVELASLDGGRQREVGRALGCRGNGSVGKQRACLRVCLARDSGWVKRLNALKEKLSRA